MTRLRRLRSRLLVSAALVAAGTVPVLTVPASGAGGGSAPRTAAAVSNGYWMYAADGGIFAFGSAGYNGPVDNQGRDIAGMAATPSGNGYWMADDDGDVFVAGDARKFGERAATTDNIAAFAARPQGDGYWMVTRTGTVEHYGAAPAFPAATVKLSHRITTMTPTASGAGAWMAGIDGGVLTAGDAGFFGSMGGKRLAQPVVGMAPTPSGRGYWLVASDGGIFSFGDARFFGSMGGTPLVQPVVGMAATSTGNGYWMVAADGGIFAFGDARFFGSMGGTRLNAPVRGMLARPGSPDQVIEPAHTTPSGGPGTPAPTSPPGTTPAPTIPPGPGPDTSVATLVGAGDISTCGNDLDEATARVLDGIPRDPSTVVWTAGDNVYNSGTPTEFANCFGPTWGRHKDRIRPAVGNHEYGTSNASGYAGYFGAVAGPQNKYFYSYDIGAWHVVVLNSQCGAVSCAAGSEQERWLRADLAASQAKCQVAIWHHPRFNSGNSHGNNTAVGPLWDALYDYGADVVLNGHEHVYERFAPQKPNQQADNAFGIRQFTVGTGGAGAYTFKSTAQPNSQVRRTGSNGVLKLTLRADRYEWQFLPVAGQSWTDTGSANCHGRP